MYAGTVQVANAPLSRRSITRVFQTDAAMMCTQHSSAGVAGWLFGAEGFEESVKFRGRGLSGRGAETVFAGVAAGRIFPAGSPRAGAAASVGAVGGDAGWGGGHASSYS
jgi:hypothetical protein